jgi:hypothetical protein
MHASGTRNINNLTALFYGNPSYRTLWPTTYIGRKQYREAAPEIARDEKSFCPELTP